MSCRNFSSINSDKATCLAHPMEREFQCCIGVNSIESWRSRSLLLKIHAANVSGSRVDELLPLDLAGKVALFFDDGRKFGCRWCLNTRMSVGDLNYSDSGQRARSDVFRTGDRRPFYLAKCVRVAARVRLVVCPLECCARAFVASHIASWPSCCEWWEAFHALESMR